MFGFIVGVGSLIGLAAVLRRRHRWAHQCGAWRGNAGCAGYGDGSEGRSRWRYRPLWRLFDRLDTTPGQEKVIREEVEQVVDKLHEIKRAWRGGGDELAQALSSETIDEATLDAILARQGTQLDEVRKQVARSLARIHEALDSQQRKRLARMLSFGPWAAGPWAGPYRS